MNKITDYKTHGTCSRAIRVETDDDGVIVSVSFDGGCNGNTKGISSLVRGMKAEEAIERLEGIRCGFKSTSCPDQLAKALKIAISED
ncbi:MAG: TIGR03905 family TSCPD domain-containing protein [Clostridia bacterium]|nr:TIGR03905 family TSCPD domain-containing protein [Clostridia bacterium]MBP5270330.1 TIGR03905 family TSCPD domain-containing protein [Clostridia bacterium]